MEVREKLVELLISTIGLTPTDAEIYANDFIAHGVTVQEDCKDCAEATQNCIAELQEKIAELRSVQEWVSVKDRLPGVGFNVLFICENKSYGVGAYSDTYRCFFSGQFPVENVTHWQYLPQPPKGE